MLTFPALFSDMRLQMSVLCMPRAVSQLRLRDGSIMSAHVLLSTQSAHRYRETRMSQNDGRGSGSDCPWSPGGPLMLQRRARPHQISSWTSTVQLPPHAQRLPRMSCRRLATLAIDHIRCMSVHRRAMWGRRDSMACLSGSQMDISVRGRQL